MTTNKRRSGVLIQNGVIRERDLNKVINFIKITSRVKEAESLSRRWFSWFKALAKNKGLLRATVIAKDVYSCALRFTAGQQPEHLPFTKAHKDGLPLVIGFLRPMLKGNQNERRAALTILSLYRVVDCQGQPPSLNPITDKGPVKITTNDRIVGLGDCFCGISLSNVSNSELVKAWKETVEEEFPQHECISRVEQLKKLSQLHISSKNGPNGPAIAASSMDRVSLKDTELLVHIKQMALLTENEKLTELLSYPAPKFRARRPGDVPISGRLRIKYEAGGKTRIFAICDTFTQSSLQGIHRWVFGWLGKQPEDGTFSHNSCSQRVREWTKAPPSKFLTVNALDLTKATDRWPRALQREVVAHIFGQEIGFLWENIIANREFVTPDESGQVRWECGQPLGALSSWGVFALTHHLVVRTLIKLIKVKRTKSFAHYQIIGDDICIRGTLLSSTYKELLEKLGVGISSQKSFSPKEFTGTKLITGLDLDQDTISRRIRIFPDQNPGELYSAAEIAKRVFVNGVELTPVPPDAIIEGLREASAFPSLLQAMEDRGYYREGEVVPVPALAALSWKPRAAIAQSTFPCACAPPYRRVTLVFKGVSSNNVIGWTLAGRDFGLTPDETTWYGFAYPVIEGAFRDIISLNIDKATTLSLKEAGRQSQLLMADALTPSGKKAVRVAHWELTRKTRAMFIYPYIVQGITSLLEIKETFTAPGKESSLSTLDLRSWIGKLHSLLDLHTISVGKTRFTDEKRKTNKVLSAILKGVNNLLLDI